MKMLPTGRCSRRGTPQKPFARRKADLLAAIRGALGGFTFGGPQSVELKALIESGLVSVRRRNQRNYAVYIGPPAPVPVVTPGPYAKRKADNAARTLKAQEP